MSFALLDDLLESCLAFSTLKLQSLNLQMSGLNKISIVSQLGELLMYKPKLMNLDISWCKLSPKLLAQFSKELRADARENLRSLNLSYNQLNFTSELGLEASNEFFENFVFYL